MKTALETKPKGKEAWLKFDVVITVIEVKAWTGKQSIHYRELFSMGGKMVKLDIKIDDSYNFQSHAHAMVFDKNTLDWKTVYSLPYPFLVTTPPRHDQELTIKHFAEDALALVNGLKSVLYDGYAK
jgi:hypothetical protein